MPPESLSGPVVFVLGARVGTTDGISALRVAGKTGGGGGITREAVVGLGCCDPGSMAGGGGDTL